jgi:hypothetical protein
MKKEEKIRNIEQKIDNAYKNYNLYQLKNRPLAQWYLLLMHEESIRLPIIDKLNKKRPLDWFEIICSIEDAKGALQFALRWIDELPNNNFRIPEEIDWDLYGYAQDFFFLAQNYYRVIGPFTLYSRGLATATFIDENTIRFARDPRESVFDVLGLIKTQDPMRSLVRRDRIPKKIEEELERVLMSAKPHGSQSIAYKVNYKNLAPSIGYWFNEMTKATYLPDDWSIKGVSAVELRRFFASIKSFCLVHLRCTSRLDLLAQVEAVAAASALLTKRSDDWIRFMARCSGISYEKVQTIIDVLTYDRNMEKRDISLQPFVKIVDDNLTICPYLIYNGNLERNFLALIAKKFKSEYDRQSYVFEERMIDRCANIAEKRKWAFSSNHKIIGTKSLADIDAAFYDSSSRCVLICQLKAVIPPSEPSEVLERAEREREGIGQAKLIKEFAEQSPELLWQSCFDNLDYPLPKIFHAVLLQGSFGSSHSLINGIPSLELEHFNEMVEKYDPLLKLCEHISSFSYLPKREVDYDILDSVIEFEKNKIIWEGFSTKVKV